MLCYETMGNEEPKPPATDNAEDKKTDAVELSQDPQLAPSEKSGQPHLMDVQQEPKKKLPLPHRSFFIALITIILTITAGVVIALFIGKMTNRGLKFGAGQETITPTPAVGPLLPIPTQGMEGIPEDEEATPTSAFESLLQSAGGDSTPSSIEATDGASPNP